MQTYQPQVLFVINQADIVEPCQKWDTESYDFNRHLGVI